MFKWIHKLFLKTRMLIFSNTLNHSLCIFHSKSVAFLFLLSVVFVKPACSERDIVITTSVRCMCVVCVRICPGHKSWHSCSPWGVEVPFEIWYCIAYMINEWIRQTSCITLLWSFKIFFEFRSRRMNVFQSTRVRTHSALQIVNNYNDFIVGIVFFTGKPRYPKYFNVEFLSLSICMYTPDFFTQINMIQAPMV